MRLRFLLIPLAVLALMLTLACGDDDDDDAGDNSADVPADTTDAANGGDDDDGDDGDDEGDDDGDNGGGGGFGSGTGTLTIGDESWEITGIGCIFSAEEARNPDFPFNLSGFGESSTGARAQLSADIYDPSGEERTEGDGVSHNISFNDVEDFENPSVAWSDVSSLLTGGTETVLTVDGKNVTGEGVFDDGTTDEIEMIPGTLEVQCP
ncbi:MAG TPA: hypothetical protein VMR52_14105 [Dehalococcoidia bacterium]|nr:hypothetical protein [Dehalococcoidia bacterium]